MFYSRDEIVAVITGYYKFVCRISHAPGDLRLPPQSGWTTVPADALRTHGGRSDQVIDLLRHLPYIRDGDLEPQVLPETSCIDYAHLPEDHRRALGRGKFAGIIEPPFDDYESLDPDVVCVAHGRRHAWSLLLDLANGTVIWHSNDGVWHDEDYDLGDVLPGDSPRVVDGGVEWRDQPTYDLRYFFGTFCRGRLNEMKWLPRDDGEIRSVGPRREGDGDVVVRRRMLVDAGWPGNGDGGGWDRERWLRDERHSQL